MKIITHRANLSGPDFIGENTPKQILKAIWEFNFDVEVDVWFFNGKYFLGHDKPNIEVEENFLKEISSFAWFHAKNISALYELRKNDFKCFFQENDDATFTSNGFIWIHCEKPLYPNSIAVLPEISNYSNEQLKQCYAICTDYPEKYKNL